MAKDKQEGAPEAPEKTPKAEKGPKGEKGEKQERGGEKQAASIQQKPKDDFKYIVRIANTDLDGKYPVAVALDRIKGIGIRTGVLIADKANVPRAMRVGDLSDAQVEALASAVEQIVEVAPGWMLNRQKDFDSGADTHNIAVELETRRRDDLNRLKKIRTNRGLRHEGGQKVRGQRSRSNGRTGLTLGVQKKKTPEA